MKMLFRRCDSGLQVWNELMAISVRALHHNHYHLLITFVTTPCAGRNYFRKYYDTDRGLPGKIPCPTHTHAIHSWNASFTSLWWIMLCWCHQNIDATWTLFLRSYAQSAFAHRRLLQERLSHNIRRDQRTYFRTHFLTSATFCTKRGESEGWTWAIMRANIAQIQNLLRRSIFHDTILTITDGGKSSM